MDYLSIDEPLLEPVHYLHEPEKVVLMPGAVDALRKLIDAGMKIAVVSNQSGVGRGFFPESDVARVHARMEELLAEGGVTLNSIHYCPHIPEDRCSCRKPEPEMLLKACEAAGVTPEQAVMVGDNIADVEAGRNAGMQTILVRTGYGRELEHSGKLNPHDVIDSVAILPDLLLT